MRNGLVMRKTIPQTLYRRYGLDMCLNANYSVIANRFLEDCIFQKEHCISKIKDCILQDEDCKSERRIAKFKRGLQTCCQELFLMVLFAIESLRLDVPKRRLNLRTISAKLLQHFMILLIVLFNAPYGLLEIIMICCNREHRAVVEIHIQRIKDINIES